MTRIYVWSPEKKKLPKLYKLQTMMQVVQTSLNAISLNVFCFLIHMSSLELHNVDALLFFMWPFSSYTSYARCIFVGLAYQGKDIVFRFIIEYSSLRDFGP